MTDALTAELGCAQLAAVFFEAFHEQAFAVCKGPVLAQDVQTWSVLHDHLKDEQTVFKFLATAGRDLRHADSTLLQNPLLSQALQLLLWMPKRESGTPGAVRLALQDLFASMVSKQVSQFLASGWSDWYLPAIGFDFNSARRTFLIDALVFLQPDQFRDVLGRAVMSRDRLNRLVAERRQKRSLAADAALVV